MNVSEQTPNTSSPHDVVIVRELLRAGDQFVSGEALAELVRSEMGAAADLAVPLDVSIGTGRSWHDAAH